MTESTVETLETEPTETATDDRAIVRSLRELMKRAGVTYSEIAAAAGISPSTARLMLATGKMTTRAAARRQLIEFARVNALATTRADIRFVAWS